MTLKGLRLIEAVERPRRTRAVDRKRKLLQQIERQLHLLEAAQRGEAIKGEWWWRLDDGKVAIAVRYGRHHLELTKGRHAVLCETLSEASTALDMIRIALQKGEFDGQMGEIALKLRANFRRS